MAQSNFRCMIKSYSLAPVATCLIFIMSYFLSNRLKKSALGLIYSISTDLCLAMLCVVNEKTEKKQNLTILKNLSSADIWTPLFLRWVTKTIMSAQKRLRLLVTLSQQQVVEISSTLQLSKVYGPATSRRLSKSTSFYLASIE